MGSRMQRFTFGTVFALAGLGACASAALAASAAELMEQHRINSVLVVDADGRLCGALNSHDLMRAKVI